MIVLKYTFTFFLSLGSNHRNTSQCRAQTISHQTSSSFSLLSTINLNSLLDILESLLAGWCSLSTEDQLSVEFPRSRDIPLRSNLGVDERVVVLEIGSESFSGEGGPDNELGHGIGLGGPDGELVSVGGEFLLHGGGDCAVFKEKNLSFVSGCLDHLMNLHAIWLDANYLGNRCGMKCHCVKRQSDRQACSLKLNRREHQL